MAMFQNCDPHFSTPRFMDHSFGFFPWFPINHIHRGSSSEPSHPNPRPQAVAWPLPWSNPDWSKIIRDYISISCLSCIILQYLILFSYSTVSLNVGYPLSHLCMVQTRVPRNCWMTNNGTKMTKNMPWGLKFYPWTQPQASKNHPSAPVWGIEFPDHILPCAAGILQIGYRSGCHQLDRW